MLAETEIRVHKTKQMRSRFVHRRLATFRFLVLLAATLSSAVSANLGSAAQGGQEQNSKDTASPQKECPPSQKAKKKPIRSLQPDKGTCCAVSPVCCQCVEGLQFQGAPKQDSGSGNRDTKLAEQVLQAAKESAVQAIDSAKMSIDTIKWVYIVQSGLVGLVGLVFSVVGGVLAFLGFKSWRDFRRFQNEVEKQRVNIQKQLDDGGKRLAALGRISGLFTSASVHLSNLALIRNEEVREEVLRDKNHKVDADEYSRMQRDARKADAYRCALADLVELKKVSAADEIFERYGNWAETSQSAAHLNAGELETARESAIDAKANDKLNHPDRAFHLGYVYARMYHEGGKVNDELKANALEELREAFANDKDNRLREYAQKDNEIELYLGKEALASVTTTMPSPAIPI